MKIVKFVKLNRKKIIWITLIIVVLAWAGIFYWNNLRGIWPALGGPSGDIVEELEKPTPGPGENNTDFPLSLKPGFSISVFAKDLPGARVITFDLFGNAWLSQTKQGTVSLLEVQDGRVVRQNSILRNLKNPHGIVFHPHNSTQLYIAEEDKITTLPTYSEGEPTKLSDLPPSGRHFTRTLGFSPGGELFVSIGSTCDVCNEKDSRIATIQKVNLQTGELVEFAKGLRNTVFFTFNPDTRQMWGTEMGRDFLGDDLPPDEINIIEEGKNYGWPICYGKNIHDTQFDKNTYIRNPCEEPFEEPAHIDLQAHSAPLGLAFIPESTNWPDDYRGDLLVAYHGSWNRTEPTGYKIVRVKLGSDGEYEGIDDFISGWLDEGSSLGRPVDLKFGPKGDLYVTDDKAGVVYKIHYAN